jgi:3-methyladenine DNA glycosylase AlkD
MTTNFVTVYIIGVERALEPLRDKKRAISMAAYMKDHFPFLGIPAPARRMAVKSILKPEPSMVHEIVRALWGKSEREYQYVALDLLNSTSKMLDVSKTIVLIQELALKKSWWDCVDGLAGVASTVLRRNPDTRNVVWEWNAHSSFWVNRLAILHQNGWKEMTDQKALFQICLAHAYSEEFFVRKAIGWALREYAWTNPVAVKSFVETNRTKLSSLSVREALKNLDAPQDVTTHP